MRVGSEDVGRDAVPDPEVVCLDELTDGPRDERCTVDGVIAVWWFLVGCDEDDPVQNLGKFPFLEDPIDDRSADEVSRRQSRSFLSE